MVKICNEPYNHPNNKYDNLFDEYPFPLSDFQKYSIEAIEEGCHVLVTAHTGSGKTLPAEHAIRSFKQKGMRVIYTSPIKALSNQKFYEFGRKFPDISFGILTGDIKANPDADVLIMTTEILQNALFRLSSTQAIGECQPSPLFSFDNVACVIFDEVHYINDADRGKVWEESIIMLPRCIQMVMLSATMDNPQRFAEWCENRSDSDISLARKIPVYLATTNIRSVPLTHYSFITCTEGLFKILKDKQKETEIRAIINKPTVLQDSYGQFKDGLFHSSEKVINMLNVKNQYIKRSFVLNKVASYMAANDLLPAICFVLSRKQLEIAAREVTVVLLEDDSKIPYIVAKECDQIMRKLSNYNEYLHLPEYTQLVSLLEKGIAIHHAGMLPIFREMVELLFAKGYVKLLFATETFAVGINMPTKTVVFTDMTKYDGYSQRVLHSHEYTQMAGRAGRRGIDTVGNVIHLLNLYKTCGIGEMKTMMNGHPQTLVSKFSVGYDLIFNIFGQFGDENNGLTVKIIQDFVSRSMMFADISNEINAHIFDIQNCETELESVKNDMILCRTAEDVMEHYSTQVYNSNSKTNRIRKDSAKIMNALVSTNPHLLEDLKVYNKYKSGFENIEKMRSTLRRMQQYISDLIHRTINVLYELKFITFKHKGVGSVSPTSSIAFIDNSFVLTVFGQQARYIRESNNIIMSIAIQSHLLDTLSPKHWAIILSCFVDITVPENCSTLYLDDIDAQLMGGTYVKSVISHLNDSIASLTDKEDLHDIRKSSTDLNYNLLTYVNRWIDADDEYSCKLVLQEIQDVKSVSVGDFVKALLKINNISSEIKQIYELKGMMDVVSNLDAIPYQTLKFVATNQSLYV